MSARLGFTALGSEAIQRGHSPPPDMRSSTGSSFVPIVGSVAMERRPSASTAAAEGGTEVSSETTAVCEVSSLAGTEGVQPTAFAAASGLELIV